MTVRASLRQRLQARHRMVGTVLSLPGAALGELAAGPFDLVWIDLEHGALGLSETQELVIAIQSAECAALVRLPHWASDRLAPVLDAGVDGVVAPGIDTADQARAFVAGMHYPPSGHRGFGPRRAGRYGRADRFWSSPAARPACLVQIETPAGVANSREIAGVPGVDALVVGCGDLSFTLGTPQELDGAAITAAAAEVRLATLEAKIAFGVAGAGALEQLACLAGAGASVLVYSADVRLYARAVDEVAAALRAELDVSEQGDRHVRD